MLIDKLRIDFQAGKGGDGFVSFEKHGRSLGKSGKIYYPQKGKPDGGNGGQGGNIYLEGSSNIYDLTSFTQQKIYTAQSAEQGKPKAQQGRSGDDLILLVPLITNIYSLDGKKILSITKHGQRKLLARGGKGGLGNYYFREGQVQTLYKHTKGTPGKHVQAFIELQLYADVIFIGFPNAGKSSLLNALTNAHVKVAAYPFTTIQPQLGTMGTLKLMDLPGLIEGVSEGKGLGKSFSKHAETAHLIAHLLSLESDDLVRDYQALRKELAAFNTHLLEKDELVIITKSDLFPQDVVASKIAPLHDILKNIIVISTFDPSDITKIAALLREMVISN